MTILRKVGFVIIGFGIIMFFIGASMFSYRGDINPIVSKIGEYSFVFWLPTIILGTIIVAVGKGKRKIIDLTHKGKSH